MSGRKTKPTIEDVKERHELRLMGISGVTGVGIGERGGSGEPCIRVYVDRATPDLKKQLPARLEGFPVDIEESGEFRAF